MSPGPLTVKPLPRAPSHLPASVEELLRRACREWERSPDCLRLKGDVGSAWRKLLDDWVDAWHARQLPLFVRVGGRKAASIGEKILHHSGGFVAPCDNSPAHWVATCAFQGICPTVQQVILELEHHQLPVVATMNKKEHEQSTYKARLWKEGKTFNANSVGWYVDHVRPVALKNAADLRDIEAQVLIDRFRKLMDPSNMVLTPRCMRGLGNSDIYISTLGAAEPSP